MLKPRRYFFSILSKTFVLGTVMTLAACEGGLGITTPVEQSTASVPSSSTTIGKDVERADIFAVSESALWDGRPSLGGVWVAYPANTDPERVIIRNIDNGKSVIGALFRRERDNPGPKIQLSSDAATALGVVAGTPAEISITVLRREEVVIEAPVEEIIIDEATADSAPVDLVTAEPIEPVTVAAPVAVAAPVPAGDISSIVQGVLAATPVVADTTAEAVIATTPLAAAPVAPRAQNLAKPFIQVGTFSTQERATSLVSILENEGVRAEVRPTTSGDTTLYRVVSGPAATRAERTARLKIIRDLGFTDAFIFG